MALRLLVALAGLPVSLLICARAVFAKRVRTRLNLKRIQHPSQGIHHKEVATSAI